MLSVDDATGPLSDEEGPPLNLNGNVLPENGAASRKSRTQMLFNAAHNDDVRRCPGGGCSAAPMCTARR